MRKLKLTTKAILENGYLKTILNLSVNHHYLCTVTLHNAEVMQIDFRIILPKICGGGVEDVIFTEELHLNSLNSGSVYHFYKQCLERYWKTSTYREVMQNYHLQKSKKYM